MNLITLTSPQTARLGFSGYFCDKVKYVFLSGADNTFFPNISVVSLFTNNTVLSSAFPSISGKQIFTYTMLGENNLSINVSELTATGKYDLIIGNEAGYSKLSYLDYLIEYV